MLSGLESEDCLFICAQVTNPAMQLRQHQTFQACEAQFQIRSFVSQSYFSVRVCRLSA
jgi:hypothetical protein